MRRHSYPFPTEFAGQRTHDRRIINNPYPDYNSASWNNSWQGSHRACLGPYGRMLDRHYEDTMMSGYHWNASGFPPPIFGSYEAWGLDRGLCADSVSRYGAYGYKRRSDNSWYGSYGFNHTAELQWDAYNRTACSVTKTGFKPPSPRKKRALDKRWDTDIYDEFSLSDPEPGIQPRTAVIMRTWLSKRYTNDDLHFIRAMIMELALHSGGEYEVVLLVDCKDTELPNSMDTVAMDKFKAEHLSELAVCFNTKILQACIPKSRPMSMFVMQIHQDSASNNLISAVLQYFHPAQRFSRLHPQQDYMWQFEIDSL